MNALMPLDLPPHSIEAEQSLIGGLLLDNSAWDRIADQVTDADFYRDDHRRIIRHIRRLIESGKPADVLTVFESAEHSNESDQIGGLAYLGEIANNTPSAANICGYAEIVADRSMRRKLQEIAMALHVACAKPAGTAIAEIANKAETAILKTLDRTAGEPSALQDVFNEAASYIERRSQRDGDQGITTGFADFDRITGGLESGQLVLVAARPSVGKSLFGGNVTNHLAQHGKSALFFTLEMTKREVGMRLLAQRTCIPVSDMRAGLPYDSDRGWGAIANEIGAASRARIFIDDKAAIGVGYVRAKARRIKRQHGLDLIVIDYLGLMTGASAGSQLSRTHELGSISRGLKALAKELEVPIIALAQLNRNVEGRNDKRPIMSDLRDSGEIEQDADIIAMLHRESLYTNAPEWQGVAELLVRKNRNGPLGEVLLRFMPECMTFGSYEGPNPRALIASRAASINQQPTRGRGMGFQDL
jgi:replicative DNA helicase